jgi:hypothetical protein
MKSPADFAIEAHQGLRQLRSRLETFARKLAAEQWHCSGSYETTVEDRIDGAIAKCKASIGEALLEALKD